MIDNLEPPSRFEKTDNEDLNGQTKSGEAMMFKFNTDQAIVDAIYVSILT
jgi:hypothetical protein